MWFVQQLLLAFLFFFFLGRYLKMRWKARRLPPGPSPFPLIGNLWTMRFNMHPETFSKISKHFGNIYTVWLGETPLIVLHGYKAVKNAIVSHSEEMSGRPASNFMTDIANGRGIVVSNGHSWRQQRRFGLMTLRNLGLGKHGVESRIQEEALSLVENLAAQNGKSIDASDLIIHSVANVISAVVFGHRFSIDDPTFQKLVAINQNLIDSLGSKWGNIHKELDEVLLDSSAITYEDRKRLPYTNAVIHEIQRFGNIASVGTLRRNIKDIILDGYPIEKVSHRICLGEQLARFELVIFFITLMRKFSFQLPEGVTEVNTKHVTKVTLQPPPYKVCIIQR
ncbi:hypothetical protein GDO78_018174 [Eleutherodactylus coqui]|uniref:Uncharacterized protein n=1 Tax=Eleutherodactylus coqui TaxID=57060 RepID=A0A8J6B987_ELECQ|nr:hypothetical protein GDO78_018174 [Eleutherodactylus coqui]